MEEASITTLICFDAIMSCSIWSFSTLIVPSKHLIDLYTVIVKTPPHEKSQAFQTHKSGLILHVNARILTELLPIATSNLLCHCLHVVKKYLETLDGLVGNELVKRRVSTKRTAEKRHGINWISIRCTLSAQLMHVITSL